MKGYEVYDSDDAFQAHLKSPHFAAFAKRVEAWVVAKELKTWSKENA